MTGKHSQRMTVITKYGHSDRCFQWGKYAAVLWEPIWKF